MLRCFLVCRSQVVEHSVAVAIAAVLVVAVAAAAVAAAAAAAAAAVGRHVAEDSRSCEGAALGSEALEPKLRHDRSSDCNAQEQQHWQTEHPQPASPLAGDDLFRSQRRCHQQLKKPAPPGLNQKSATL